LKSFVYLFYGLVGREKNTNKIHFQLLARDLFVYTMLMFCFIITFVFFYSCVVISHIFIIRCSCIAYATTFVFFPKNFFSSSSFASIVNNVSKVLKSTETYTSWYIEATVFPLKFSTSNVFFITSYTVSIFRLIWYSSPKHAFGYFSSSNNIVAKTSHSQVDKTTCTNLMLVFFGHLNHFIWGVSLGFFNSMILLFTLELGSKSSGQTVLQNCLEHLQTKSIHRDIIYANSQKEAYHLSNITRSHNFRCARWCWAKTLSLVFATDMIASTGRQLQRSYRRENFHQTYHHSCHFPFLVGIKPKCFSVSLLCGKYISEPSTAKVRCHNRVLYGHSS